MRVVPVAVAVALLALASALPGCAGPGDEPTGDASSGTAGLGTLRGLVVDAGVRPLSGVEVTASGPATAEPRTNTTGADGLFRFDGLAPGSYTLTARKETYLSATALAQAVADEAEPPLVQLVLAVQTDEIPFVEAIVWDGYIGCAFAYGNLCSAPAQGGADVIGDQSAHLFWDEYVGRGRVPDLVQAEATWEATLSTSAELSPIFGWSTPAEWQAFQYGGRFDSFSTGSPMFYRLTAEQMAEAGLGVEVGLVVEFYSGHPGGVPSGLTANQPIRLILHNFYGYLPPEDWRFVTDGAPPPP